MSTCFFCKAAGVSLSLSLMATILVPQQDSRSDVWTWFVKCDGRKKAKCNLCGKKLAFHGGTTNLQEHLLAKHSLDYKYKGKEDET